MTRRKELGSQKHQPRVKRNVAHRGAEGRSYPEEWRDLGEVVTFELRPGHGRRFWALFEEGVLTATWPAGVNALAHLSGCQRDDFYARVHRARRVWRDIQAQQRADTRRFRERLASDRG